MDSRELPAAGARASVRGGRGAAMAGDTVPGEAADLASLPSVLVFRIRGWDEGWEESTARR